MTTATNGSGNYSLIAASGDYIVQAGPGSGSSPACFLGNRYYDVLPPSGGGRLDSAADVITVGDATVVTGIDITLSGAGV